MNSNPLLQRLLASGPVLTDGAWGTQLQARGLAIGEFPDAWNLTHPDKVTEVARAYVDAGSQIILTNTFGANRLRLAEAGLADRVAEINEAGRAFPGRWRATRRTFLPRSAPSGKMLMSGETTSEEIGAAFCEQAAALARGGADALVVETMTDLEEAKLAVAAAKTTGLPVVASMVFDAGRDKDRTMMGTTPEQAAAGLVAAGADVVGANCGQGIAGFGKICARLKTAAAGRPVWIKANAGRPELRDGKAFYATTPEQFAS